MKITLRADEANGTHTRFTVFMNGGKVGTLDSSHGCKAVIRNNCNALTLSLLFSLDGVNILHLRLLHRIPVNMPFPMIPDDRQ